MGYARPQENIRATWLTGGRAKLVLTYQGREWYRQVGPRDLVTVIEAAALLGVSRSAPYQWAEAGRIPWEQTRLGDSERDVLTFRLSDLLNFGLATGLLRQ